ncbi:MAG: protease modulator HflK, partial [Psychromonas sp.]
QNSSKVLIDNQSGSNLTFLPLDKLMSKPSTNEVNTTLSEIETRSRADEQADNAQRLSTSDSSTRSSRSTGRDY